MPARAPSFAISRVERYMGVQIIAEILQERGMLAEIFAPLDISPLQVAAARRLGPESGPARWLEKWSYRPRSRSAAAWQSLAVAAAYRGSRLPGVQPDFDLLHRWRERSMDGAVARALPGLRASAFIGLGRSSARSLASARRLGMLPVLQAIGDDWGVRLALEEEVRRARTERERAEIVAEFGPDLALPTSEVLSAGLVFVESSRMQKRLMGLGAGAEKMVLLGNGVDTDAFRPMVREARAGLLRVVSVCRVGYAKGIHYAAEAVRQVGPAVATLTVVGADAARATHLKRLYPEVRFTGELTAHEVRKQLAEADVFLLPTLAESMARAILEAMAVGLPVITTDESGYAETAKDGEEIFLVPTRDVDSIARLLVRLAGDQELRDRAGRAARRFAEGYSWERYRAKFSRTLDERILPSLGGSSPGGT